MIIKKNKKVWIEKSQVITDTHLMAVETKYKKKQNQFIQTVEDYRTNHRILRVGKKYITGKELADA